MAARRQSSILTNNVRGRSAGIVVNASETRLCEACGRPVLRTDAVLGLLTGREFEVLSLLTAGLSNQEIAAGMKLSEKTVKLYLSHIYQKLGVTNRTEAALVAVGWLTPR